MSPAAAEDEDADPLTFFALAANAAAAFAAAAFVGFTWATGGLSPAAAEGSPLPRARGGS